MHRSLTSYGITKARYTLFKKFLGLDPSCRCDYRRAVLNRFGQLWDAERKNHGLLSAMSKVKQFARESKDAAQSA